LGLLFVAVPAARAGDDLPGDSARLVQQFQQDVDAIQARADDEIAARKGKLLEGLRELRDSYAKAGRYDEALAVHERIRCLEARRVEVEWGGTWWPAEVLKTEAGRSYIRYVGWDDSWNEWVTRDRVRPVAHRAEPAPRRWPPAGGGAPGR
jgi:hypothetical protein